MDTISWNLMRSRVLAPLVVLLLAAGLAACNRPSGDEPGSCAPEDLVAPDPTYPVHNSVISDLSPTFEWTYPDYSCLPSEYSVLVSSSNSWFDSGPILARAVVSGTTSRWDPGLTLAPGDIYYFMIHAREDGETGPGRGIFFFTGPRCSETGDAIQAPALVAPADGERLTAMRAHLRWDDPTPCVSMYHYWIEVARSPSFADAYVRWTSIFEDEALPDDTFALEPCTTYYWRVRSGSSGSSPDGPYSETWSFTTPSEPGMACLMVPVVTPLIPVPGAGVPATAHGAIAGHVWHDECAVPYESTDVAPPGCVIMPDGGMEANGILDPGESGIEGVTVRMSSGACPGEGSSSSITNVSGQYGFHDLPGGTYCVKIDAATDGNDTVLIPGNWTVPYRWYGPGPISTEVTLSSDDDISRLNDFAWDFQFLPSPSGALPSGTPYARVLTDARCRLGPGLDYPVLTYLSQGLSFPITGRLEQGGWWQLRAADLHVPCWIGEDVVEPYGDLTGVPFVIPPALPTPTPTEEPPSQAQGCYCRQPNQTCAYVVPCPAQCIVCTPP